MAGELRFATQIDNTQLRNEAKQTENILSNIGRTAQVEGNRVDGLVGSLTRGLASLGVAFGAGALIRNIVQIRGEFQQLGVAFETMLGSRRAADEMMRDITELALSTPYTVTEVAQNTRQLIAMGIAAEDVVDTMRALGDVASGVAVPIQRIAINYGQVATLGRLQSREIRDFAMAGVPIVQELANILGKTSGEVQDMVQAGQIGFPLVEQAFRNMSSEGGRFFNLMEKQVGTVTGQINRLEDQIELMFNEIGTSSEGIIYGAIDAAAILVENYEKVGRALGVLVASYGLYRAALIANIALERARNITGSVQAFLQLARSVNSAREATNLLNIAIGANPWVKIGAAILAVGGLIWTFARNTDSATDSLERLEEAESKLNSTLGSEIAVLDLQFRRLNKLTESSREYSRVREQIENRYSGYLSSMTEEQRALLTTSELYDTLADSISRAARARAQEDFIREAATIQSNVQAESLATIRQYIERTLGTGSVSDEVFTQIRDALREANGGEVYQSLLDILRDGGAYNSNRIGAFSRAVADYSTSINNYSNALHEAELIFGDRVETTTEAPPAILSLNEQIEVARQNIANLTQELAGLRSGNTVSENYVEDISAAEAALKNAREELNILLGIDPKAQQKAQNDSLKLYDNYLKAVDKLQQDNLDERVKLREDFSESEQDSTLNELNTRISAIRKERREFIDMVNSINSARAAVGLTPIGLTEGGDVDVSYFDNLEDNASERARSENLKRQREYNQQLLEENATYETRRLKIISDGEKAVQNLVEQGADEEAEVQRKRTERLLRELADGQFRDSDIYSRIFQDTDNLSTESLEAIFEEARRAITENTNLSVEEADRLQKRLTELQNELVTRNPFRTLTVAAREYFRTLREGTADEKQAAGSLLSNALSETSDDIIQVTQSITGLLDSFGVQLPSEASIAVQGILGVTEAIGEIDLTNPASVVSGAINAVAALGEAIIGIFDAKHERNIQRTQNTIDSLAQSYDNLSKEIDKAYSVDAANLLNEANSNAEERIALIDEQIRAEEAKKKTDNERVKQYREEQERLREEIEANNEAAVNAIFGTDIQSAISSFADAYLNAWEAGEDRAASMRDVVRNMIKGAIRELLNSDLSDAVESVMEMISGAVLGDYLDDSDFINNLNNYIDGITNQLDDEYSKYEDILAGLGGEDSRTATARGIATASQDSVDELNGRFTAIQGHTFVIMNNTNDLLQIARTETANSVAMLNHVAQIHINTDRLAAIEDGINNIQLRGITIRE